MRPNWLRIKLPSGKNFNEIRGILQENRLHTVCVEAMCPNIGECFERRTVTFLMLGNTCTRSCGFCAVKKGSPSGVDKEEPRRIAEAIQKIGLEYVVLTSVTRDDLPDGGASIYAEAITLIREYIKNCRIEVLIPDFCNSPDALDMVIHARPDIVNHNIETVPRLYSLVRPMANYGYSLKLLKDIRKKNPSLITKSGFMVGLGETWDEIIDVMGDIKNAQCDMLTIGQYLSPHKNALTVHRYYKPEEFERLRLEGERMGFHSIESGPLVRSSYHAHMQSCKILTS
ncbi:lipoyl synthase [Candidatus Brocadia sapporoensis]|uniref:Lipoyl synthase n=1 Tax=Candidatus Brocadia sapporoensis TaxID=392547 RepID=A0A1V6LYH7_9BACT|nr:lipoyl synthase [Candidatus Brocadia sapporoensis]MDG6004942.1 lipoyl synthase [Candidatus Brocadia sp.]OQD45176.1 lipoyl synthase [Candidatus Brocadia sapporoensis]